MSEEEYMKVLADIVKGEKVDLELNFDPGFNDPKTTIHFTVNKEERRKLYEILRKEFEDVREN